MSKSKLFMILLLLYHIFTLMKYDNNRNQISHVSQSVVHPFQSEASQDNLIDQKNTKQFTPWFRKRKIVDEDAQPSKNPKHHFLAKLNLSVKFPRQSDQQEHSGEQCNLIWMKRNNKFNIKNSSCLPHEKDSSNNQKKISEKRSLFKHKQINLHKRPKSIDLTFGDFFEQNQRKNTKRYDTPRSRIYSKQQVRQSHKTHRQEQLKSNAILERQKLYKTLELKLNEGKQIKLCLNDEHKRSTSPDIKKTRMKLMQNKRKCSELRTQWRYVPGRCMVKNDQSINSQKVKIKMLFNKLI